MMKTDFKFSTLIGTVYRNGNVVFSGDGNSVVSPVGNKITIFDLKNDRATTISVESNLNVKVIALNPNGMHAFLVNEGGEALYVNLFTQVILYRHRFNRKVEDVKFSFDGRRLAVCRGGEMQIFMVAGIENFRFNPFVLLQSYKISAEQVRHIEWSYDDRLLAVGSDDKQVRIVAAIKKYKNLSIHSLAAHKAEIIGNHFEENSYNLITIDKRGLANHWMCALSEDDLVKGICRKETTSDVKKMWFEKTKRHNMMEHLDNAQGVNLAATAFHAGCSLLITAFTNGVFLLHEMPSFNLIHSLRVSEVRISSLSVNKSGDWLAIACGHGTEGQLVVWEWQSETYIMKQQSHSQSVNSVAYSPDGSQIATGGEDGKVKIWSARSSFCIVTFTEHSSSVSAVCWTSDAKAVLSASLDGTVRAHDLRRYRNFRFMVCPEKTQLGSLAVDSAAELVMAASVENFNIYVWSMESGKLLDMLSGHSSPVASISVHGNKLASTSWDKTIRIWNVIEASAAETIDLLDEGLDIAYSPMGDVLAVLCLDSTISLFETENSTQLGSIDTALDVDAARISTDIIKKKTSEKSRTFTVICFSPDGSLLLAAGQSNFVCIYCVAERLIVKKLKLTTNRSLDGVAIDINRRNFTEFGNMMLIDASDSEEEADNKKRIKLPGTRHSDAAERIARPVMRVMDISFSPTGRCFAVCSTEGVAVFSLDHRAVFNPFELTTNITPEQVESALANYNYLDALKSALGLNEKPLIEKVLLSTPIAEIRLVVQSVPLVYAERLLISLAGMSSGVEKHVEFWQIWLKAVLQEHGCHFKQNRNTVLATLTALQQKIANHRVTLSKIADQNIYTLDYLITARRMKHV